MTHIKQYLGQFSSREGQKMRFFAMCSSARRDRRLSTMGMGRVDTPSRVVGGELLDPPGWGAAVES